jgi:hypothetical protein
MDTNQTILEGLAAKGLSTDEPTVKLVSLIRINGNWCVNEDANITERNINVWYLVCLPGIAKYNEYQVVTDKSSFYRCEEITKASIGSNAKKISALDNNTPIPGYVAEVIRNAILLFDQAIRAGR